MNIWMLCGLPGSGKSTQGKKLAKALGWKFVDTDLETEKLYLKKYKKSCSSREICEKHGFELFRELEVGALADLKLLEPTVMALGGGTLLDFRNRARVRNFGKVIYLKGCLREILPRIMRKGLPSYLDSEDPEVSFSILKDRLAIYEMMADLKVDTEKKDEEEVFNILYEVVNNGK